MPHAPWRRLEAAAPDVELVPVEGWVEADRAIKEPAELERVAAACAVADRALATLLPEIRPGATEHDLALELEWLLRTGGAEAVAFDADVPGRARGGAAPRRARPSGRSRAGAVVLFDFGAQVDGYRSDMTRTLFVGRADASAISRSTSSWRAPRPRPSTQLEAARRRASWTAADRPRPRRRRPRA